jgi:uncharacterized RDD family membrane protein YckC
VWVDLLLIAGLVFFVALLLVFLGLFGLLFSLVLLTFVSHSFLLRFFDFSIFLRGRSSITGGNHSPLGKSSD